MSSTGAENSSSLQSVPAIPTVDANGYPFQHEIEAELLGPMPRRVHLSAKSRGTRRWLWNLLFGIGLVLFYFGSRDIAHWEALRARGIPLQATVTSKEEIDDDDGVRRYINYSFEVEHATEHGFYKVFRDEYDATQKGDSVRITYLPGSNGNIWEQGTVSLERQDNRLYSWIGWFLGLAFPFGLSLIICESIWRRESSLLRNGIATTAWVKSGQVITDEGTSYTVFYEYQANNKNRKGQLSVTAAQYIAFTEVNPGFTVIYDPEDIFHNCPYFQMRSVLID